MRNERRWFHWHHESREIESYNKAIDALKERKVRSELCHNIVEEKAIHCKIEGRYFRVTMRAWAHLAPEHIPIDPLAFALGWKIKAFVIVEVKKE
jgi:hypothetical protein